MTDPFGTTHYDRTGQTRIKEESVSDHLDQTSIDAVRDRVDRDEIALRDLVGKLCPGPHLPKQHRDRKPPWCRECGRTARGVAVR